MLWIGAAAEKDEDPQPGSPQLAGWVRAPVIPEQGPVGATGARGDTGAAGAAATISVGSVTTGAAGSSATVTNSGTSSVAIFDFAIPRGDTGTFGRF